MDGAMEMGSLPKSGFDEGQSRFAILLPVKAEGGSLQTQQTDRLHRFFASMIRSRHGRYCSVCRLNALRKTLTSPTQHYVVILGIDVGGEQSLAVRTLRRIFAAENITVAVESLEPGGRICAYWRTMARTAYRDHASDFYLLLGDDVEIISNGVSCWTDVVENEFLAMYCRDGAGRHTSFGCVALRDKQAPGFPTFPVLCKSHMEAFNGEIFDGEFVNQDADPFLFQLYRRFGAARYSSVCMQNHCGGARNVPGGGAYVPPRYAPHNINWKPKIDGAAALLRRYADMHLGSQGVAPRTTIDVIVPTYRMNREYIERICALRSTKAELCFIIIIDNPLAAAAAETASAALGELSWLTALATTRDDVRVRVNDVNRGASYSRNRGLDEAAAAWIVFLDDDVIPDPAIIDAYTDAIEAHGTAVDGFVGYSDLPSEPRVYPTAVHLSGVSFFWRAARQMVSVPWGITANLCVRRLGNMRFNEVFSKTGGGEDIDFCLQLPRLGLHCVPAARICHPWWSNGSRVYNHFFNWSYSDSQLQDIYPEYTYRSPPDSAEFFVLTATGLITWHSWFHNADSTGYPTLFVKIVGGIVLVFLRVLSVEVLFDMYEHLYLCREQEPHARGWLRFAASLESTLIRSWSRCGRLLGHLRRGRLHNNVCKRFDWFCGQTAGVVEREQWNAWWRFAVFAAVTALALGGA